MAISISMTMARDLAARAWGVKATARGGPMAQGGLRPGVVQDSYGPGGYGQGDYRVTEEI